MPLGIELLAKDPDALLAFKLANRAMADAARQRALPVSWKGTLIQYTGRLHRLHPAKKEVRIFDYVDTNVPMLFRMFKKRLRGYRGIGYARGEAPLGLADSADDLVVEYDQDVLRSLEDIDDFT